MPDYAQLLEQKAALARQAAELDRQIAAARNQEQQGVINQIKELLSKHDLTVADLQLKPGKTKGSAGPAKGSKVLPKYRSANGETWSGRGLQPKWVKAAISGGAKLEDLAIS